MVMQRGDTDRDVHVFDGAKEVAAAAAELFVGEAQRCYLERGRFVAALSGGSTPRGMFRILADVYRGDVPWEHTHLFWGDERVVPLDDPQSNYAMARETLLDHVPVDDENVYPVPVHLDTPGYAAAAYEITIRAFYEGGLPSFDLALLGMGEDGHTASLFPRSGALHEREAIVVATVSPVAPRDRVTLTLPVINASTQICVVVAGASKRAILRTVLAGDEGRVDLPASLIRRDATWYVDEAAYGD
jgi:6-phosphogluconolactonase